MTRPNRALQTSVVRRAKGRCEYCHFPAAAAELSFHFDHIIAEKHKGPTNSSNLAWACFSCSLRKGPNIAGLDPVTGVLAPLYNPRSDKWREHFAWEGVWLRGKTAIGRTTIAVLNINDPDSVAVRRALRDEGVGYA